MNNIFKGYVIGPSTFSGALFAWFGRLGTSIEVSKEQIILNYRGVKNVIKKDSITEIIVGEWVFHGFHSAFEKNDNSNLIHFSYLENGVKKVFTFSALTKQKLVESLKSAGYSFA